MELHSDDTTAGMHIPMISAEFEASHNYCFLFHYHVWMSEISRAQTRLPELEIYISETSHVFSGRKVWGSNGPGEGLVQIPVWSKPGAIYRISFVGIANNPRSTLIKVANVTLNQGECLSLDCDSSVCADEIYASTSDCELFVKHLRCYIFLRQNLKNKKTKKGHITCPLYGHFWDGHPIISCYNLFELLAGKSPNRTSKLNVSQRFEHADGVFIQLHCGSRGPLLIL